MNIIDDLKWRGAINQQTDAEGLKEAVENKKNWFICRNRPNGG